MKKLGCLSALLLSGAVSANGFNLEQGQWAFHIKDIDLDLGLNSNKYISADGNTEIKRSGQDLATDFSIDFAATDKITLSLAGGFDLAKDSQESTYLNETSSEEELDLDYSLMPSMGFEISRNLMITIAGGIALDNAVRITDEFGNIGFEEDAEDHKKTFALAELQYLKRINERVNLIAGFGSALGTEKFTSPLTENENRNLMYSHLYTAAIGQYFFADHFSAQFGLSYYRYNRLAYEINEESINTDYHYNYFSSSLGFTYYLR